MHAFCTSTERESILKLFNLSLFPNSDHLSHSPQNQPITRHARRPKSMLPIVFFLYQSTINTLETSETKHQFSKHFSTSQNLSPSIFQVLEQFGVLESELEAEFLGSCRA
jgi:hypothetical protein